MNDEPQPPTSDQPPSHEHAGMKALTVITMMGVVFSAVPPLRHLKREHHSSDPQIPDGAN